MLFPPMAAVPWGFEETSGPYRFAVGYGATLMAGWTGLLLWAYRRPLERRFVAALTVFVIYGLVLTEIVAVSTGALEAWRMIPTWCIQVVLLCLFVGAYHYRWLERELAA